MERSIRCSLLCCCILVLPGAQLWAADNNPAPAGSAPALAWTVDDVLSEEGACALKISPDCHWVAWEKTGSLFVSSLTEKKEIRRTQPGEGGTSPKWSPDGSLLAFIASRPNPKAKADTNTSAQVWVMRPCEGDAWPITAGAEAVSDFDWSGTNAIVFLRAAPQARDQAGPASSDTSVVVGEALEPTVRLFRADVNTGAVTPLTQNTDSIGHFWVSPNGRYVVTMHVSNLYLYDQGKEPLFFVIDLTTGQQRPVFNTRRFGIHSIHWERDSSGFYATCARVSHYRYPYPCPLIIVLNHYTLASGAIEPVELQWDKGLCQDTHRTSAQCQVAVTDDGFITLLADGVRAKLARYWRAGSHYRREFVTGIHSTNAFGIELGQDGKTLLYQYSTSSQSGQWYRAELDGSQMGAPVQVTSFNPQFQAKPMAAAKSVRWKGARGETVEGMLYYPFGYQAGKKYPLVVDIHGGPANLVMDKWYGFLLNNNLLNERGAFVFRPNYHGSSNYGLKWAESIIGRLNQLEVVDIETGVDYLIAQGLVDPQKLAVKGWSQGGVLTAAVTASTRRYKAAVSADGVVDWINYWARSDVGGWFCGSYFGKTPLEDPSRYVRSSSFYQLSKVTTPTLILFGKEDARAPVEQGWMYYRALQQTGKTKVRFVLFPEDGHAPMHHAKRAVEEELAWWDKFLF